MKTFFSTIIFLLSSVCSYGQMIADTTKAVWNDSIPETSKTYHRKTSREIGKLSSDIKEIRGIVSPLGEGDPVKWAQTLPGITTGADETVTMYVRGGNASNSLVSLDGIPLYGYSHILGLTTMVPMSILSSSTLIKGGFEGANGNFSAALLKMQTRTPQEGFKAEASINSFLTAAKNILPSLIGGIEKFKAGVGDTYGKIRYSFKETMYLELSGLKSIDNYNMSLHEDSSESFGWGNSIAFQYPA